MGWLSALACAVAHSIALQVVSAQSPGFILISSPRNSRVSYQALPESGSFNNARPRVLIDTGLQHPQGIAFDQKRKRLFVADPDAQKIYSYRLIVSGGTLSVDGERTVVSRNAESRWVAVDGSGDVFFSDEPLNQIMRVTSDKVLRGDPTPEVVFTGSSISEVNEPGGVAVDNFHVYWTNKHFATQAGSLVKGSERPSGEASSVSVLARNTVKSYGVCIALGNVFYTDSEKRLYGVKKVGSSPVEVTSSLQNPRGCVWDGDGTVYVADRGANAVYSFAGNMHTIAQADVTRSFDMEDPFGLAVVLVSAGRRSAGVLLAFAATLSALLMR